MLQKQTTNRGVYVKNMDKDSKPVSIPKRKLKKGQYGLTVYDYMVERYISKQFPEPIEK